MQKRKGKCGDGTGMETFRVPSIRLTGRACNQPLTQYPGPSAARPKGKTDEMTRSSCLFGGKNRRRGRRREREMGREIRGMLEVFGEKKPERPELEAEERRMGRLQTPESSPETSSRLLVLARTFSPLASPLTSPSGLPSVLSCLSANSKINATMSLKFESSANKKIRGWIHFLVPIILCQTVRKSKCVRA